MEYVVAAQQLCEGDEHIKINTKSNLDCGGEGIIIRKYNSPYYKGRSELLFKFKVVAFYCMYLLSYLSKGFKTRP